jgi:ribonuclease HI
MSYYAVANGRINGIFTNWNECNHSIKGFKNAIFKKFNTKLEAEDFIRLNQFMGDQSLSLSLSLSRVRDRDQDDFVPDYYVYTDGACSNNGKRGALAGIGIFFGINDSRNVSKRIEGKQTNNMAELTAIIETYSIIESDIRGHGVGGGGEGLKKVTIVTDSEYAMKCVSSYGEKCDKKGWDNLDIPNQELVKIAYNLYKDKYANIRFLHIKAHTNKTDVHSIGNENADKLANMAIGLESCPYTGK